MSKLSDNDLNDIRTICEFIFFDQFKDSCTFESFEKYFSVCFKGDEISLNKVFVEIIGEKRKYLTFPRFIRAFMRYKSRDKNNSRDFNFFFEKIFEKILLNDDEFIGKNIEGNQKFSTAVYQEKGTISKIQILTDNKENIFGINIVYDENLKCEMFPKKIEDKLKIKIDMKFGILDESILKKIGRKYGLKEKNYKDCITHIFGTFKEKITFLGFKCRSGKTEIVGKPEGTPFVFGSFGEQFHYVKFEVDKNKGITFFQPRFIKSVRTNVFIRGKIEDILKKKDEPIKDEVVLQTLEDEIAIDKMITTEIIPDNYFFNSKLEDKIKGKKFNEVINKEPRKWLLDDKVKPNGELLSLNEILNGYDQEVLRSKPKGKNNVLRNRKVNRWDGKFNKNQKANIFLQDKKNYKMLMNKLKNQIQNEINDKSNKDEFDVKKSLLDMIVEDSNDYKTRGGYYGDYNMEKMNKKRMRNYSDANYNKKPEILKSKIKGKLKNYNRNNFRANNYQNSYFSNALNFFNDLYGQNDDDFFDEDEDDDDFYREFGGYGFNNNYPSRKNYSNYYYVVEEEDNNGNKRKYISVDKPLDNDPKKIKKCVENWRKCADGLRDSQGIYILQTIGNVIKAVTILEKCEYDKNYDKKISVVDKLKMYKTLEENERIINFLCSGHKKSNKNISLEEDDNDYDVEDDDEDTLVCDEHPEKITDLAELKTKMESIEDYLKKKNLDETKREKLQKLYDLYNQQKNILIENETESNKKEVISNNKINYHNLIKEEENKRNKEIEAEQDRIKELNTIAQNALFSGLKDIIKTVSIRDRPTPNKIYKNQKIPTSGKPFTDTLFPPEKKSLCPVNRNGSWILPKECIDDDVYGWEDIKWARVGDIFDSDNFQVFEDKIEADDIMQGSLGDCYFLSAIGSLCRFTKLIEKLFYFKEKSKENCYGIYLFINGIWELILIDDYMPYLGSYFKNFAFSSTTKNELWVMLLEKAWAKINGCYAKAGSGGTPNEVFEVITEAWSQRLLVKKGNHDEIWEALYKGNQKGYIMTAGTSGDTTNLDTEEVGLSPGHAYTISDVVIVKEKRNEKLVKLRNPWGSGEWNGDWCDTSSKWTESLKKKYGLTEKAIDDGDFFMAFEDFCKYYAQIGICKLHEDFVTTICRPHSKGATKPFVVKVTNKYNNVHCYFSLYQKNPRVILKDGTYQENVYAYLVLCDEKFNFIQSIAGTDMHLCVNIGIDKGTYYLISDINYRYVNINKKVHGYNVTCYAAKEIQLENVTDNVNINECLDKCIYSYCKSKITPTKQNNGVDVYMSKTYNTDFPFVSCLFENTKSNDASVDFNVKARGSKSFCFYADDEISEDDVQCTKKIPAKGNCIIKVMQYSINSLFTINYNISASSAPSNEKKEDTRKRESGSKEDIVFQEEGEELDEDGTLIQYLRETNSGYVVGLENRGRKREKMKLTLEGLEFKNREYKGKNPATFIIEAKSKMTFELGLMKRYYGDVTFEFDFA